MEEHSKRPYKVFEADPDAQYDAEYTIDLSTLRPTVAFPHLPENTHTIDEIHEMDAIAIDQVVSVPAPTDVLTICAPQQRYSRADMWRKACAAS